MQMMELGKDLENLESLCSNPLGRKHRDFVD